MASLMHPTFSRRTALQAGASSILGLGLGELNALRAAGGQRTPQRSVIYIFLSGGLSQHESFDPKPDAPDVIRGEFQPIATATPGLRICEHLPLLAARSRHWSVVRSLTHPFNEHSIGHHVMLTGRSDSPPGFNPSAPKPSDHPSIAAVAGAVLPQRQNLPPAVVLPERLIHRTGRVIPGQFAGIMGRSRDPWFLETSPFQADSYGAYPEYEFDHQQRKLPATRRAWKAPDMSLPQFVDQNRLDNRLALLRSIDAQRAALDRFAAAQPLDDHRQAALSLLTDPKIRTAIDVTQADSPSLDRYGRNAFGWSLLTARRLVETGVGLVQVHLGNNETWDTHGNMFPHLKDKLLPPTDRAVSALIDDLHERGLLETTLIVMAGEFGRTPRLSTLGQFYKGPGRDHWGAVQSVLLAGGGVIGGRVVGSTDKNGGFPRSDPQTPENLGATIYRALGVPSSFMWQDAVDRPHHVYHGEPIFGLG